MIEVEGVTKEYVSNKKYPGFRGALKGLISTEKIRKTAVDDISFHIDDGEIVGCIGSNGAGKSTTIKMMTGILVPTKGSIKVNGIVPYENRQKNAMNIGAVFGQRTQLWWDLPLSETFTVLKEVYCVNDEDFKERMKFLYEVLGLEEFIHNTVRTLSLGQRMRADITAALVHNPKIVYLDEPTIGLDLVVKDKIREAIKEMNRRYNTTVILTTHDLGDIEELCERIIIIDHGKKLYDGTISDIKEKYGKTRKVTIDVKDITKVVGVNFNEEFRISEEDLSMQMNNSSITFTMNKSKINVSDILVKFMEMDIYRDIKIEETSIEEIVKGIYLKGL